MIRRTEVIFLGCILFVGGSLAGRFILPDASPNVNFPQSELATALNPDVESSDDVQSGTQLDSSFENWVANQESRQNPGPAAESESAGVQHASFERLEAPQSEFNSTQSVDGIAFTEDSEVDSNRASAVIREHFPDMAQEMIQTLAEQYADIPAGELSFLMEQRKALGETVTSAYSTNRLLVAQAENGIAVDVQSSNVDSVNHKTLSKFNVSNLTMPGFRQRLLLAPHQHNSHREVDVLYDFSIGRKILTGNPIHVLIDEGPEYMFRLEPGNLVTRCGRFEILDDGKLGLRINGTEHALFGSPQITDGAFAIMVYPNGAVIGIPEDLKSAGIEIKEFGIIPVVRCENLGLLQSDDGVVFECSEDFGEEQPSFSKGLVSGQLELSNVDHELQQPR